MTQQDKLMSRVAQLLLVALSAGATDSERVNAITLVQRQLEGAGCDSHELIERLKTDPLGEEDMQKIFDAGVAQGREEEVEKARLNAVAAPPVTPLTPPWYGAASMAPTTAPPMGVVTGVNGYTWLQIAEHFVRNQHLLNDWERDFATDMARKLHYITPSPKQAEKIHQIFQKKFGERI
jgi:hypothetical protein